MVSCRSLFVASALLLAPLPVALGMTTPTVPHAPTINNSPSTQYSFLASFPSLLTLPSFNLFSTSSTPQPQRPTSILEDHPELFHFAVAQRASMLRDRMINPTPLPLSSSKPSRFRISRKKKSISPSFSSASRATGSALPPKITMRVLEPVGIDSSASSLAPKAPRVSSRVMEPSHEKDGGKAHGRMARVKRSGMAKAERERKERIRDTEYFHSR